MIDMAGRGRMPSQPHLPPTSSSVVARSAAPYAFGRARDPAQQAPAALATSEVLEEEDEDVLAEQDSARKHVKVVAGQGIPQKGNAQGSAAPGAERVADDLLPVYCAGTKGLFHRSTTLIECYCGPCIRNRLSKGQAMLTPTEFEKHAGNQHFSVRHVPLQASEFMWIVRRVCYFYVPFHKLVSLVDNELHWGCSSQMCVLLRLME
jgi:hypothetical protein